MKYTPFDTKAADPTAVALDEIKEANGVPELIVVLP